MTRVVGPAEFKEFDHRYHVSLTARQTISLSCRKTSSFASESRLEIV